MKLTGSHVIPVPRDRVYAALTDPNVLQRAIPGCERMVKVDDDTYDVHLKVGIAGLKGSYVGKARLSDRNPPESYVLTVEGKGAPGFVKGRAVMRLTARADATDVAYDADAQVGGVIAAVGSRLVEATARKLIDDFFRSLAAAVL